MDGYENIVDENYIRTHIKNRVVMMCEKIDDVIKKKSIIVDGALVEFDLSKKKIVTHDIDCDGNSVILKERAWENPKIQKIKECPLTLLESMITIPDNELVTRRGLTLTKNEIDDSTIVGNAIYKGIDAIGLNALFHSVTPVYGSINWKHATWETIRKDIDSGMCSIAEMGAHANMIYIDRNVWSDLYTVLKYMHMTMNDFLNFFGLQDIFVLDTIKNSENELEFNPNGNVLLCDNNFCGIYAHLPIIIDIDRDVANQSTNVYFRKRIGCFVLDNDVIYVINGNGD